MAKVTITRGDVRIDADLNVEQIQQLLGMPPAHTTTHRSYAIAVVPTPTPTRTEALPFESDFSAFYSVLSERAKKFIDTLTEHPNGIESDDLAIAIGFTKANQIGGLIGRGIKSNADNHQINISEIYRTTVSFRGDKRILNYYPGSALLERTKKPA